MEESVEPDLLPPELRVPSHQEVTDLMMRRQQPLVIGGEASTCSGCGQYRDWVVFCLRDDSVWLRCRVGHETKEPTLEDGLRYAVLRDHKARRDKERAAWDDAWQDTGKVFAKEDGSGLPPETVSETFRRILATTCHPSPCGTCTTSPRRSRTEAAATSTR